MGDTELEEGEASCSYMNNDQNIEIDVALSYIDERIQDVLGQYQKEFEGGISADNLGARFGGYGSFLPTYQRSPSIWSHSKAPHKGQNSCSDFLPVKGAQQNSTIIVKPEPASTDLPLPELRNTTSVDTLPKVWNSGDCVSSHKPLKLPMNQSDKKTLKFRIKVGSDNVLTETNAAIYSNLGLDMSPSSASEDSPAEWEGNSADSHGKRGESPSCIIKIMTSFPIPNGVLLSPLHGSLVRLMEEKNLLDGSRSVPVQERSAVFENEVASKMHGKKVLGEKKGKHGDKNRRLVESKNRSHEGSFNPGHAGLKKEGKIKISTSKEIVYDNSKLHKSSKPSKGSDKANGTGVASETNIGKVKDRFIFPNIVKEETLGPMASRTDDKQEAKNSLAGRIQKDKRVGRDLRKDGGIKGDRSLDLFEEQCDMPKGRKVCAWGTVAPTRQNCERKATHRQDGVDMSHGKEQLLSGGEKKSNGSQNCRSSATKTSKESLGVSLSSASKDNITYKSHFPSKSEGDDKLHTDLRKAKDSFSDSTTDQKLAKKECITDILGAPPTDQAKDSKLEVSGEKSFTFGEKSKERSGKDQVKDSNLELSGKKSRAFSNKSKEASSKGLAEDYKLEVYEKESHAFSKKLKERSGNKKNRFPSSSEQHTKGHLRDATTPLPTEIAPVVIEENWVCCDKCHKWRLLPYGTNPDHLPKRWLCSMLNWLPGMNCCSISEEETTNALNASYQVPVSEIRNNRQNFPVGTLSRGTLIEAQHLIQNCQDLSFSAVHSGGKKRHRTKAVSNVAQHSGSVDMFNCKKKNLKFPVKSKDSQNPSQYSLELKLEERSDDANPLKKKSRRESDQDGFRPSKKAKTESMNYTDRDKYPGGLPMKEVEMAIQKNKESCSIDIKGIPLESSLPSVKRSKKQVHKTMAVEDHDKSSIDGKKRKLKEQKDTQIQLDNHPSNRHYIKDEQISKERSGKERRKEKKRRPRIKVSGRGN